MKIQFDPHLKVAGIGTVPWARLGPERWFAQYKIASYMGWDIVDVPTPDIITAHESFALTKFNTQSLLEQPAFQDRLLEELSDYTLMTYKPIVPPAPLSGFTFLASDQTLASRLENKAEFRELMRPLGIPFPAYRLYNRRLSTTDYAEVMNNREAVVLQDEQLSGGKGTKFVTDEVSFERALSDITGLGGGKNLVVSEVIAGARERSLQGCVTKYGVFIGPLQKQIVGNPLLANLNVPDGDRFCGAEVGFDDAYQDAYDEMRQYAAIIGKKAQELGYRGIFGVDFLIGGDGRVYVLEMNPRITGVTPLLTMLYREGQDIPFYLLHILELSGADYRIEDASVDDKTPQGSLLVVHTQSNRRAMLQKSPKSGLYDYESVEFMGSSLQLNPQISASPQLLVQQYMPEGAPIRPGGRIVTTYSNRPVLAPDDTLLASVASQVERLSGQTALQGVENKQ